MSSITGLGVFLVDLAFKPNTSLPQILSALSICSIVIGMFLNCRDRITSLNLSVVRPRSTINLRALWASLIWRGVKCFIFSFTVLTNWVYSINPIRFSTRPINWVYSYSLSSTEFKVVSESES